MKKIIIIAIIMFVFGFGMVGCTTINHIQKDIKADEFLISYEMKMYQSNNKINPATIESVVDQYNNLEIYGKTNAELNLDKAISIIFYYNDQISRQITIDDKGVCKIDGNKENYNFDTKNGLYEEAFEVYKEIEAKYNE